MSRPRAFPAEQKVRIVLSIVAGEITAVDAARQSGRPRSSCGCGRRVPSVCERKAITSIVVATSSFDKTNYDVATGAAPTYFLAVRQLGEAIQPWARTRTFADAPGP